MTNGAYNPHINTIVKNFIQPLLQNTKKYQPTLYIDVIPPEYLRTRILGKINTQRKCIPDFVNAIKNNELTIDEFATSLASKIQVSHEIFADYVLFHKLPKHLLDEPIKIINSVLQDCEETLQNPHMVHADVYYLRFRKMLEPLELIKKSLQDALKLKNLVATEDKDLAIFYAQQLIDLLNFSLKEFAKAPTKQHSTVKFQRR